MIRVAIVDDEELVCTYLRRMLHAPGSGVEVVGHAHDVREARDLLARTAPQVVLLDIRLDRADGLVLLEDAHQETPSFLVLTGYPDDHAVLRALRSGATGFLTKSTSPREIVSAIHLVAAGHRVVGSGLPGLGEDEGATAGASHRLHETLTTREAEVLRRLGTGWSNADIAKDLGLSEGTVKGHVSSLMAKLGCRNRLQAGLIAQRAGW